MPFKRTVVVFGFFVEKHRALSCVQTFPQVVEDFIDVTHLTVSVMGNMVSLSRGQEKTAMGLVGNDLIKTAATAKSDEPAKRCLVG